MSGPLLVRRLVGAALGGVLFAAVLVLALWSLRAAAAPADATTFFAETLMDLKGRPAPLESLRGRPLVVNFWARWCAPCRTEIPALSSHWKRFRARGVELVGIAVEDKPQVVEAFARAYDIDYPVLVAGPRGLPLLQALGDTTAALPYTVVFDRRGNPVYRKLGALDATEMEAAFAAALAD